MLFSVIVLIFSAIIHEYMHGWVANQLGDPTARLAGRLTLNPLAHIDPFGSIFLPLILILSKVGFVFGWAKPVPFNPYNLRDQKYGPAKVAAAGPLANLVVAAVFGLLVRLLRAHPLWLANLPLLIPLLEVIVFINVLLAVFNLVPIPPMDGSKIIMPFLPYSWQLRFIQLEKHGMLLVLLFIMFGFSLIIPIINFLTRLFIG
jgi:Zn-dependent protease